MFTEIKKLRNSQPCVANSMDGVKVGIADHFKNIYSGLYNSVDDHEDLVNLCESVEEKVNVYHLHDVNNVTPEIVKRLTTSVDIVKVTQHITSVWIVYTMVQTICFPCSLLSSSHF